MRAIIVDTIPNSKNATIVRRVFTRSRVKAPSSRVRVHSLDDLYEE